LILSATVRLLRSAAAAGALAAFALAGCGPKYISTGAVPFPAEGPVFVDDTGRGRADLPSCAEPVRVVLLDFAWCPPCADVWKSLALASKNLPAGSVRVYRILFDRERRLSADGAAEVAPLRAVRPPDAGNLPVTTLTALPQAFRERYGISQAPLLLLLDAEGRVVRRWTGSSPSLPAAVSGEIMRLLNAPPLPET
jgi:hypothetical protein